MSENPFLGFDDSVPEDASVPLGKCSQGFGIANDDIDGLHAMVDAAKKANDVLARCQPAAPASTAGGWPDAHADEAAAFGAEEKQIYINPSVPIAVQDPIKPHHNLTGGVKSKVAEVFVAKLAATRRLLAAQLSSQPATPGFDPVQPGDEEGGVLLF